MATLLSSINSVTIPSDYNRLMFYADTNFTLRIDIDNVAIYTSILYPNTDKKVAIFGLADLIYTYLDSSTKLVEIYINGSKIKESVCLPCSMSLDMSLQDFLDSHFLSRADGIINTYRGSIEYVNYYDLPDRSIVVKAVFLHKADGSLVEKTINNIAARTMDNYMYTVELDIDDIASYAKEDLLVEVIVAYDSIVQRFKVCPSSENGEHLYFRNAFGCLEHVFFPFVESKLTPEAFAAQYEDKVRNYKVKRKTKFSGEAQITDAVVNVFEDLLVSKHIYRQKDGVELRIENGEIINNTDFTKMPIAKVTWTFADNINKYFVPTAPKTFDYTFDYTFE